MANDPNNIGPVWSATEWSLGACAACPDMDADEADATNFLQYTHCGGTGAICINKRTGKTCSVGTAPVLGDFPGGVIDFIWWGSGAYALNANGNGIYALGTAEPVTIPVSPLNGPPWTNIFSIGPATIGVSGPSQNGTKVITINTNSVAEHTCC